MATENRKAADTAPSSASPSAPAPSARVLTPAGESSDPDVHFLIAERRAHELVLAQPDATEANKEHAASAVDVIDARLKEMGYR